MRAALVADDDVASESDPAIPIFCEPLKDIEPASAIPARPKDPTSADAINSSFFIITPFELMNIH
jgi:hypothetical protein